SLRIASEVLARGDVVCIFAEGGITRTGFLLPFQRGIEQVLKRSPVPVVPVCLDHVWGSVFSYRGSRFLLKWPSRMPYPVNVAFGKPLPPTVTAFEVRQAIQQLSADVSVARAEERRPVHRQFVRRAARHPFRTCFIDAINNKVYSYAAAVAGARILSQLLRPKLAAAPMVGLWLPSCVGGALAPVPLAFLPTLPPHPPSSPPPP